MSNFWIRLITGTLLVAVMVGAIIWNAYSVAGLFLVVTALGLWEFFTLFKTEQTSPQRTTGTLIGVAIYVLIWSIQESYLNAGFYILIIGLLIIPGILELWRNKEQPISNVALTVFGIVYVTVPFFALNLISGGTIYHANLYPLLLGFFILMWTSDTGAYLVGRAIGRTKFFERISPKKTWEGTIGGVALACGMGYLLSILFAMGDNNAALKLDAGHWINMALIISIFGSLGDLIESMFKRSVGAKDSGTILPGHGGILDRFDGVILAAPMTLLYIMFFVDISQ